MASTGDQAGVKPARNWWKIGFFVMLIMFEAAREWAVAMTYEPPKISSGFYVGRVETLVSATGRWKRTDKGSELVPGAVRITCWQEEGRCYEISYSIMNGYAGTPHLDEFDAKFSEDAVTYENDNPDCARYHVRIDLGLKKVFAVRERKDRPANPGCSALEKRVEMTLGDGFEYYDAVNKHFLPLIWVLKKALGN